MGFELPFVIGPEYIAVALFGVVIGSSSAPSPV